MMGPKISIIISVYNVEIYLAECLNSILSQTLKAFELILVNDGSTDNSLGIMNFFAAKDPRITVLNQSNQGISTAKNAALSKACGEYILFVDGGDMIVCNTLEVLYRHAVDTGADLVNGNILLYNPGGMISPYYPRDKSVYNTSPIPGHVAYMKLITMNSFHPKSCLFFIKRDIIVGNQLFYKENILYEDELWTVKAIFSAAKVLLIDFDYYLYRQRIGSMMYSDNILFRVQSLIEIAKELNAYIPELKKRYIPDQAIRCMYEKIFRICRFIHSLLYQNKTIRFSCQNYFSDLLISIYPSLPYTQQRYCLQQFYISQLFSLIQ